MAKLVVVKGPDRGKIFRLSQKQPQIIGRKNAPLLLSDAQSSRNHAEFFKKEGRWFIKDLGSANGTIVNHEKIDGIARLRDGYAIKLGMTKLIFKRSTKKIPRTQSPTPTPTPGSTPGSTPERHAGGSPEKATDPKSAASETRTKDLSKKNPEDTKPKPKPKSKSKPKPKKQDQDKINKLASLANPNDASSLMMAILEDITPEPVVDPDLAEYIPDYDPMNPKTHRAKNSLEAEPDAETVVPEEIDFDIDLDDHEDEPSLDDSSMDAG